MICTPQLRRGDTHYCIQKIILFKGPCITLHLNLYPTRFRANHLISYGHQIDFMPPVSIAPPPSPPWSIPKFKLTIEDLDHEGVNIFFTAVQPKVALREAVIASFKWLYTPETAPTQLVSPINSYFMT